MRYSPFALIRALLMGCGTFATLAGVAVLAGCATGAQRQVQAIQAVGPQLMACIQQVYNAPEAAILRPHVPLDPKNASLAQLSDQSLATKPETDAIMLLHPRLQECRRTQVTALVSTAPTVVPILIKAHSEADDDVVQLVQRKMQWGEVVRRQRDRQMAVANQAVGALEMQHQNEVAARQAALNALSQWAQTQQVINAMNRPVITNCSRVGNFTNCTSQ